MTKRATEQQYLAALQIIVERQTAYQIVFGDGPAAREVLLDLADFCGAEESVFSTDERQTYVAIGRHEVWLRLQRWLKLTPEALLERANGGPIEIVKPPKEDARDDPELLDI